MSTFFLLSQCDSFPAKVCGKAFPVIRKSFEAGTHCADVRITNSICQSVVLIVAICVVGFLAWKLIDYYTKKAADKRKRKWEEEDKKWTQKAGLLDKYLDFLKENASKDDKRIQDYKEVIAGFKESLQKEGAKGIVYGTQKEEMDKDKLIEILEKQLEFLKDEGFKSNAIEEKEYENALAYLIEMSQKEKMKDITHIELQEALKKG